MKTTRLKKLALLGAFLPLVALAQEKFTVNGKVGKLKAPAKAYLGYVLDNKYMIRDSVEIKKGVFHFEGTAKEPLAAVLMIRHDAANTPVYTLKDQYSFYLENADIKFTSKDSIKHAMITGSPTTLDNLALDAAIKPIKKAIDGMYKKWTGVKPSGPDDREYNKAADSLRALMAALKNAHLDFIDSHRQSYIALISFNRASLEAGFDAVVAEAEFNKFPDTLRKTSEGIRIAEKIVKAKKSQVGVMLADFTQNDVHDKPVKLSDFRGKYVLVDFWASWCGPCRAENPHVKDAYEKLKGNKFEIIGVSLDESKKAWLNAIEKDGLPWVNVSDLKGWKNAVAITFGISAVPQNFLVDPHGVVIAKNLRGEALYEQLKELIK